MQALLRLLGAKKRLPAIVMENTDFYGEKITFYPNNHKKGSMETYVLNYDYQPYDYDRTFSFQFVPEKGWENFGDESDLDKHKSENTKIPQIDKPKVRFGFGLNLVIQKLRMSH